MRIRSNVPPNRSPEIPSGSPRIPPGSPSKARKCWARGAFCDAPCSENLAAPEQAKRRRRTSPRAPSSSPKTGRGTTASDGRMAHFAMRSVVFFFILKTAGRARAAPVFYNFRAGAAPRRLLTAPHMRAVLRALRRVSSHNSLRGRDEPRRVRVRARVLRDGGPGYLRGGHRPPVRPMPRRRQVHRSWGHAA